MKQKLLTLLTLLLCAVTGAWAQTATFNFGGASDEVAGDLSDWTTSLSTGSSANVVLGSKTASGKTIKKSGSEYTGAIFELKNQQSGGTSTLTTKSSYASISNVAFNITASDAGKSYLTVQVSPDADFSVPANIVTIVDNKNLKNDLSVSSNGTFVSKSYDLDVETTGYVRFSFTNNSGSSGKYYELDDVAITYVAGAAAPVFTPASGSLPKNGSVSIESANSTSIKYAWTDTEVAPDAEDYSDYSTALTVTDKTVGTTYYLYAYGVKGGEAGSVGHTSFTITAADETAPAFVSSDPANGATGKDITGTIALTFDESIATVDASKFSITGATLGTVAIDDTNDNIINVAYSAAAYNSNVTLSVAAGAAADASGNETAALSDISFTTAMETVETPTITVYGNKVVKIECATAGATIYYGGSDVKTGEKTEYTDLFIPAANGTVYAYAVKAGANDSEVASKAITLPVVGDVTGNLLIALQPEMPASDTEYDQVNDLWTYTKAGYKLQSTAKLLNTGADTGYPNMFKPSKGTFTITPPADVTIQSIKIYGESNDAKKTNNIQEVSGSSTLVSDYTTLIQKNIIVGGKGILSEIVLSANSPAEGATIQFKLGGDASQARLYVEVYGTTSATTESVTPAKTYTTYVPTHNLDFTSTDKLTAYIATAADADKVTLTSVDKVPAGTPLVLKATETGSAIGVTVAASTDDVSSNLLRVGDGKTAIGGSGKWDYILSDGKFYHASAGVLPAGKCYLHLDADPGASAPELNIVFGDENGDDISTAIENIKANDAQGGEVYNLNGQRIAQPSKGLYIVNGRKVIVK